MSASEQMPLADLESLEETLDIVDSAALLADIREGLSELGAPDVLSKEEALRLIDHFTARAEAITA
jgi:hypothetical protein